METKITTDDKDFLTEESIGVIEINTMNKDKGKSGEMWGWIHFS